MEQRKDFDLVFGVGPLGLAVADCLMAKGRQVRLASRHSNGSMRNGYEWQRADAGNPDDVKLVAAGAATIYLCAAPPYANWNAQFLPMLKGVIEGAQSTGSKIIFADNLYSYGAAPSPLVETLPPNPQGIKGKVRASLSQHLMDAHHSGKIKTAIGRAADFYGPQVEKSALGAKVFEAVLQDKPVYCLGDIDAPHSYTYIENFARGLVTLGSRSEALGGIWHIPSGETLTTRQMVSLISDRFGKKPKYKAASRTIVTALGLFNPMMRELKEVFYQYEKPFVMNCHKFVEAFGDIAIPHQEALRKTADWVSQKGSVA